MGQTVWVIPRRRNALTLVEILIAVVLAAIVIGAAMGLIGQGARLTALETQLLGLQLEAQKSLVIFLADLDAQHFFEVEATEVTRLPETYPLHAAAVSVLELARAL